MEELFDKLYEVTRDQRVPDIKRVNIRYSGFQYELIQKEYHGNMIQIQVWCRPVRSHFGDFVRFLWDKLELNLIAEFLSGAEPDQVSTEILDKEKYNLLKEVIDSLK